MLPVGVADGRGPVADGRIGMAQAHMSMPLLPHWLAWIFVVALAAVLALHLWHAWAMNGQVRLWHTSHIVMAAGMIVMFALPTQAHPTLYRFATALYALLAAIMLGVALRRWHRAHPMNWLWAASALDMIVMVYMTLPDAARSPTITDVAIIYLAAEIMVWLLNPVPRLRELIRRPDRKLPETGAHAAIAGAAVQTSTPTIRATSVDGERETVRLAADVTAAVRVTLAVMAASMAWMLIAMQTMTMVPAMAGM